MSQLFVSGDQSIGALASASVLPMSIQGWFPLNQLCFNNTHMCIYMHVYIYRERGRQSMILSISFVSLPTTNTSNNADLAPKTSVM